MDSCNRLGKTRRPQISFEIDYILSFSGGIVKRFAKIGSASVSAVCLLRVSRLKGKRKPRPLSADAG